MRLYKIVTLILICILPLFAMTSCSLFSGDGEDISQPITNEKAEEFVILIKDLSFLYGDFLDPEEKSQIEGALNLIDEQINGNEEIDLISGPKEVIFPILASKAVEGKDKEELKQILIVLTASQLLINNHTQGDPRLVDINGLIENIKENVKKAIIDK